MPRTRIKFCGITTVNDALAAAAAGADAIGLNFYSASARYIDPAAARKIVDSLPAWVTPVGLFVNESVEHVRTTAAAAGLTHVQLHGNESPDFAASLAGFRVLKAIHVTASVSSSLEQWRNVRLDGILLETHTAAAGGSGVENDWAAIKTLQAQGAFTGLPSLILAGGLTPENVGEVVRRLRPYAVDVSSGIEQSKGIKSIEKMRAFADAVRVAGSQQ